MGGINFNFIDEKEETVEVGDVQVAFEEEIPEARTITDPEVQASAKRGRKRRKSKRDNFTSFCRGHLHIICDEMMFDYPDTYSEGCACECHEVEDIYAFSKEWALARRKKSQ